MSINDAAAKLDEQLRNDGVHATSFVSVGVADDTIIIYRRKFVRASMYDFTEYEGYPVKVISTGKPRPATT